MKYCNKDKDDDGGNGMVLLCYGIWLCGVVHYVLYHTTQRCILQEFITTMKTSNLTQDKDVSVNVKSTVCIHNTSNYFLAVTGLLI